MFFKLFMKECSQTAKSLTYWLMVIIMVLFFASQMDMEKAPEKGMEDYGVKPSKDKNIIMSATLGMLAEDWYKRTDILEAMPAFSATTW